MDGSMTMAGSSGRRRFSWAVAIAVLASFAVLPMDAATAAAGCPRAVGALTQAQVPAGTSVVRCGLVGKVIRHGTSALTVPPPGTAVGSESLRIDGIDDDFQIEVSASGVLSYPAIKSRKPVGAAAVAADLGACDDGFYDTNDLKEYGTYNWYIGDGGMPAALSQAAAQTLFAEAIGNITNSFNNCNYTDQVSATSSYQGTTTFESDINSAGTCTDRDGKSTWDAGDLPATLVAKTCWWSVPTPGLKNDLIEADVRYNTTDFDFTNNPTAASCVNKYDVRSVGTHEAGHVFGMADIGTGHSNLTMYKSSFTCSTIARTLGKGDILGLRSIY